MAAGTFTFFDSAAKIAFGGMDLTTATVKCALVTSAYTPNLATHTGWADASGSEIANGVGYTTGGATIGTPVLTAVTNGFKFSSANVQWTATGGNIPAWRRAVFYISGTVEGITNPLIGAFLGDSTPADVPATSDGNPLTLNVPANGWFDATHA
jgi:hypothetical protein